MFSKPSHRTRRRFLRGVGAVGGGGLLAVGASGTAAAASIGEIIDKKAPDMVAGTIKDNAGDRIPYWDEDLPDKNLEEGDRVRFDTEQRGNGREFATNLRPVE